MSTLTKILIILLTIASFFLCAMVVTYVATADNYKQQYNKTKDEMGKLSSKKTALETDLTAKIAEIDGLKAQLATQVAALKTELEKLTGDLKNAEREKADLLVRVNTFASTTDSLILTNKQQEQHLKDTLEELKKVQAKQIEEEKELNEASASLMEKAVAIETLESEKKRLVEDKTELQSRLDQMLQKTGFKAAETIPVTPSKTTAKPAEKAPVRPINLNGLITDVDLKNSLASISIGSADGVLVGMVFHVTHGDQFICDIKIIDVEPDKSVGTLKLVTSLQPKAGDTAATNF